jgi:hypothetical protein
VVVFPLGFLPAREGPMVDAGTGPSTISTSSSESANFLLEARRVEANSVAEAGDGASTSIRAGSSELEFDNRGRGGGCNGLERADDGAIDGLLDLDLCERVVEAGDGLRERDIGR